MLDNFITKSVSSFSSLWFVGKLDKSFDPISEHRFYCPWAHVEADPGSEGSMPGWRLTLQSLLSLTERKSLKRPVIREVQNPNDSPAEVFLDAATVFKKVALYTHIVPFYHTVDSVLLCPALGKEHSGSVYYWCPPAACYVRLQRRDGFVGPCNYTNEVEPGPKFYLFYPAQTSRIEVVCALFGFCREVTSYK